MAEKTCQLDQGIGDIIFPKKFALADKIKAKVYVNQHITVRHAYDFSLCFHMNY